MLEDLLRACREGSTWDVQDLFATFPSLDVNAADELGETALHVACASGHLESVRLLHSKGANLNAVTEAGDTVLHFAAKYGRLAVVKYLEEQHADLNAKNEARALCSLKRYYLTNLQIYSANFFHDRQWLTMLETPIHIAASRGYLDVLNHLCQSGGDYNMQNIRGSTALHLACERCDEASALRLVHYACRTDIVDQMRDTALHVACREELLPVVKAMCAYGCPVDSQNLAGMTPLHLAAKSGNADVVRCLLLAGADTEKLNKDGNRAEELALGTGNAEVADLLGRIRISSAASNRDACMKQLVPSTQQVGSIKLKVFGSSGVGKSTLIESLKTGFIRGLIRMVFPVTRPPPSPIDRDVALSGSRRRSSLFISPLYGYTKGIEVQRANISDAGDLSIWEFSGYEPYYLLYDQFMGEPNCIHLVVSSMKDSEEVRNKQIKFWLNFIRARMTPSEPIGFAGSQLVTSRVLLVATHADEAQCPRDAKGQYTLSGKVTLISDLLRQFGADILIGPDFFVLDANQPSSGEMKALRATIATMKTFIVQFLSPCLGFHNAVIAALPPWVRYLAEYPVVTWPTFVEHIRSKVNLLATEEHIRELARQLQIVGEIVALKTGDDNEDILVLSPHWLCTDVIGELLSHERNYRAPLNGRLSVDAVRAIFPRCDLSDVTTLLETLQLSSRAQVTGGETEYDVPFLNVLECPTKLWDVEDARSGAAIDVWGGVNIASVSGMRDQLAHVFPRIQTYLRARLSNKGHYVIYNWRWGSKVKSGDLGAVVELRPETWAVELRCRGPSDQRAVLFFFQEELCEIVFSIINRCLPGLYLERQPMSVAALKERRVPCLAYEPRAVLLAQINDSATVALTSSKNPEQLVDLMTFGSRDIFARMMPGIDLHISTMSLYARYVLACQLDPSNSLGHDWCLLAILLGLVDQVPGVDVTEAAALSKTDAILALWSRRPEASFRALYEKLMMLARDDAVDALLSLTPLYRYTVMDVVNKGVLSRANSQARSPVGNQKIASSLVNGFATPYLVETAVLRDQPVVSDLSIASSNVQSAQSDIQSNKASIGSFTNTVESFDEGLAQSADEIDEDEISNRDILDDIQYFKDVRSSQLQKDTEINRAHEIKIEKENLAMTLKSNTDASAGERLDPRLEDKSDILAKEDDVIRREEVSNAAVEHKLDNLAAHNAFKEENIDPVEPMHQTLDKLEMQGIMKLKSTEDKESQKLNDTLPAEEYISQDSLLAQHIVSPGLLHKLVKPTVKKAEHESDASTHEGIEVTSVTSVDSPEILAHLNQTETSPAQHEIERDLAVEFSQLDSSREFLKLTDVRSFEEDDEVSADAVDTTHKNISMQFNDIILPPEEYDDKTISSDEAQNVNQFPVARLEETKKEQIDLRSTYELKEHNAEVELDESTALAPAELCNRENDENEKVNQETLDQRAFKCKFSSTFEDSNEFQSTVLNLQREAETSRPEMTMPVHGNDVEILETKHTDDSVVDTVPDLHEVIKQVEHSDFEMRHPVDDKISVECKNLVHSMLSHPHETPHQEQEIEEERSREDAESGSLVLQSKEEEAEEGRLVIPIDRISLHDIYVDLIEGGNDDALNSNYKLHHETPEFKSHIRATDEKQHLDEVCDETRDLSILRTEPHQDRQETADQFVRLDLSSIALDSETESQNIFSGKQSGSESMDDRSVDQYQNNTAVKEILINPDEDVADNESEFLQFSLDQVDKMEPASSAADMDSVIETDSNQYAFKTKDAPHEIFSSRNDLDEHRQDFLLQDSDTNFSHQSPSLNEQVHDVQEADTPADIQNFNHSIHSGKIIYYALDSGELNESNEVVELSSNTAEELAESQEIKSLVEDVQPMASEEKQHFESTNLIGSIISTAVEIIKAQEDAKDDDAEAKQEVESVHLSLQHEGPISAVNEAGRHDVQLSNEEIIPLSRPELDSLQQNLNSANQFEFAANVNQDHEQMRPKNLEKLKYVAKDQNLFLDSPEKLEIEESNLNFQLQRYQAANSILEEAVESCNLNEASQQYEPQDLRHTSGIAQVSEHDLEPEIHGPTMPIPSEAFFDELNLHRDHLFENFSKGKHESLDERDTDRSRSLKNDIPVEEFHGDHEVDAEYIQLSAHDLSRHKKADEAILSQENAVPSQDVIEQMQLKPFNFMDSEDTLMSNSAEILEAENRFEKDVYEPDEKQSYALASELTTPRPINSMDWVEGIQQVVESEELSLLREAHISEMQSKEKSDSFDEVYPDQLIGSAVELTSILKQHFDSNLDSEKTEDTQIDSHDLQAVVGVLMNPAKDEERSPAFEDDLQIETTNIIGGIIATAVEMIEAEEENPAESHPMKDNKVFQDGSVTKIGFQDDDSVSDMFDAQQKTDVFDLKFEDEDRPVSLDEKVTAELHKMNIGLGQNIELPHSELRFDEEETNSTGHPIAVDKIQKAKDVTDPEFSQLLEQQDNRQHRIQLSDFQQTLSPEVLVSNLNLKHFESEGLNLEKSTKSSENQSSIYADDPDVSEILNLTGAEISTAQKIISLTKEAHDSEIQSKEMSDIDDEPYADQSVCATDVIPLKQLHANLDSEKTEDIRLDSHVLQSIAGVTMKPTENEKLSPDFEDGLQIETSEIIGGIIATAVEIIEAEKDSLSELQPRQDNKLLQEEDTAKNNSQDDDEFSDVFDAQQKSHAFDLRFEPVSRDERENLHQMNIGLTPGIQSSHSELRFDQEEMNKTGRAEAHDKIEKADNVVEPDYAGLLKQANRQQDIQLNDFQQTSQPEELVSSLDYQHFESDGLNLQRPAKDSENQTSIYAADPELSEIPILTGAKSSTVGEVISLTKEAHVSDAKSEKTRDIHDKIYADQTVGATDVISHQHFDNNYDSEKVEASQLQSDAFGSIMGVSMNSTENTQRLSELDDGLQIEASEIIGGIIATAVEIIEAEEDCISALQPNQYEKVLQDEDAEKLNSQDDDEFSDMLDVSQKPGAFHLKFEDEDRPASGDEMADRQQMNIGLVQGIQSPHSELQFGGEEVNTTGQHDALDKIKEAENVDPDYSALLEQDNRQQDIQLHDFQQTLPPEELVSRLEVKHFQTDGLNLEKPTKGAENQSSIHAVDPEKSKTSILTGAESSTVDKTISLTKEAHVSEIHDEKTHDSYHEIHPDQLFGSDDDILNKHFDDNLESEKTKIKRLESQDLRGIVGVSMNPSEYEKLSPDCEDGLQIETSEIIGGIIATAVEIIEAEKDDGLSELQPNQYDKVLQDEDTVKSSSQDDDGLSYMFDARQTTDTFDLKFEDEDRPASRDERADLQQMNIGLVQSIQSPHSELQFGGEEVNTTGQHEALDKIKEAENVDPAYSALLEQDNRQQGIQLNDFQQTLPPEELVSQLEVKHFQTDGLNLEKPTKASEDQSLMYRTDLETPETSNLAVAEVSAVDKSILVLDQNDEALDATIKEFRAQPMLQLESPTSFSQMQRADLQDISFNLVEGTQSSALSLTQEIRQTKEHFGNVDTTSEDKEANALDLQQRSEIHMPNDTSNEQQAMTVSKLDFSMKDLEATQPLLEDDLEQDHALNQPIEDMLNFPSKDGTDHFEKDQFYSQFSDLKAQKESHESSSSRKRHHASESDSEQDSDSSVDEVSYEQLDDPNVEKAYIVNSTENLLGDDELLSPVENVQDANAFDAELLKGETDNIVDDIIAKASKIIESKDENASDDVIGQKSKISSFTLMAEEELESTNHMNQMETVQLTIANLELYQDGMLSETGADAVGITLEAENKPYLKANAENPETRVDKWLTDFNENRGAAIVHIDSEHLNPLEIRCSSLDKNFFEQETRDSKDASDPFSVFEINPQVFNTLNESKPDAGSFSDIRQFQSAFEPSNPNNTASDGGTEDGFGFADSFTEALSFSTYEDSRNVTRDDTNLSTQDLSEEGTYRLTSSAADEEKSHAVENLTHLEASNLIGSIISTAVEIIQAQDENVHETADEMEKIDPLNSESELEGNEHRSLRDVNVVQEGDVKLQDDTLEQEDLDDDNSSSTSSSSYIINKQQYDEDLRLNGLESAGTVPNTNVNEKILDLSTPANVEILFSQYDDDDIEQPKENQFADLHRESQGQENLLGRQLENYSEEEFYYSNSSAGEISFANPDGYSEAEKEKGNVSSQNISEDDDLDTEKDLQCSEADGKKEQKIENFYLIDAIISTAVEIIDTENENIDNPAETQENFPFSDFMPTEYEGHSLEERAGLHDVPSEVSQSQIEIIQPLQADHALNFSSLNSHFEPQDVPMMAGEDTGNHAAVVQSDNQLNDFEQFQLESHASLMHKIGDEIRLYSAQHTDPIHANLQLDQESVKRMSLPNEIEKVSERHEEQSMQEPLKAEEDDLILVSNKQVTSSAVLVFSPSANSTKLFDYETEDERHRYDGSETVELFAGKLHDENQMLMSSHDDEPMGPVKDELLIPVDGEFLHSFEDKPLSPVEDVYPVDALDDVTELEASNIVDSIISTALETIEAEDYSLKSDDLKNEELQSSAFALQQEPEEIDEVMHTREYAQTLNIEDPRLLAETSDLVGSVIFSAVDVIEAQDKLHTPEPVESQILSTSSTMNLEGDASNTPDDRMNLYDESLDPFQAEQPLNSHLEFLHESAIYLTPLKTTDDLIDRGSEIDQKLPITMKKSSAERDASSHHKGNDDMQYHKLDQSQDNVELRTEWAVVKSNDTLYDEEDSDSSTLDLNQRTIATVEIPSWQDEADDVGQEKDEVPFSILDLHLDGCKTLSPDKDEMFVNTEIVHEEGHNVIDQHGTSQDNKQNKPEYEDYDFQDTNLDLHQEDRQELYIRHKHASPVMKVTDLLKDHEAVEGKTFDFRTQSDFAVDAVSSEDEDSEQKQDSQFSILDVHLDSYRSRSPAEDLGSKLQMLESTGIFGEAFSDHYVADKRMQLKKDSLHSQQETKLPSDFDNEGKPFDDDGEKVYGYPILSDSKTDVDEYFAAQYHDRNENKTEDYHIPGEEIRHESNKPVNTLSDLQSLIVTDDSQFTTAPLTESKIVPNFEIEDESEHSFSSAINQPASPVDRGVLHDIPGMMPVVQFSHSNLDLKNESVSDNPTETVDDTSNDQSLDTEHANLGIHRRSLMSMNSWEADYSMVDAGKIHRRTPDLDWLIASTQDDQAENMNEEANTSQISHSDLNQEHRELHLLRPKTKSKAVQKISDANFEASASDLNQQSIVEADFPLLHGFDLHREEEEAKHSNDTLNVEGDRLSSAAVEGSGLLDVKIDLDADDLNQIINSIPEMISSLHHVDDDDNAQSVDHNLHKESHQTSSKVITESTDDHRNDLKIALHEKVPFHDGDLVEKSYESRTPDRLTETSHNLSETSHNAGGTEHVTASLLGEIISTVAEYAEIKENIQSQIEVIATSNQVLIAKEEEAEKVARISLHHEIDQSSEHTTLHAEKSSVETMPTSDSDFAKRVDNQLPSQDFHEKFAESLSPVKEVRHVHSPDSDNQFKTLTQSGASNFSDIFLEGKDVNKNKVVDTNQRETEVSNLRLDSRSIGIVSGVPDSAESEGKSEQSIHSAEGRQADQHNDSYPGDINRERMPDFMEEDEEDLSDNSAASQQEFSNDSENEDEIVSYI